MNIHDVKDSRLARFAAAVRSAVGLADRDDEGLSLLNIMAALLIAGLVIAAFAIPSFLGARRAVQNGGAESNANSALTALKTEYAIGDTYTGITAAQMQAASPDLTWLFDSDVATSDQKTVSFDTSPNGNAALAVTASPASSGQCYGVLDVEATSSWDSDANVSGPGVYYGHTAASGGDCSPSTMLSGAAWQSSTFPTAASDSAPASKNDATS